MRLTNKFGFPQPVVDAVRNDPYDAGDSDSTVTKLVGPARKAELTRLHAEEIVEDASDRIFSLLGQSIHTILERANVHGIAERRLTIEVGGWKISGGMDLYEIGGTLYDYKVTSVYAVKDGAKLEWACQLNCYAHMLRMHGQPVKDLKIVAILRDWSKRKARTERDYPPSQVLVIPVPVWPDSLAASYLAERVRVHQEAQARLPLCSDEERWAKPDAYAVIKPGAKKALKLHPTETAAVTHAAADPKLSVVKRPGENTRCDSFCAAAPFCAQYQALSQACENGQPAKLVINKEAVKEEMTHEVS